MTNSLPVLQGHWRLLEPKVDTVVETDETCSSDYRVLRWVPVHVAWIGTTPDDGGPPIRRRVAPTPKCETCPSSVLRDAYNRTNERPRYCERFLIPRRNNDYCSEHPQAQEVTR